MKYSNTQNVITGMSTLRFLAEMDGDMGYIECVENIIAATFVVARDIVQGSKDCAIQEAHAAIKETMEFIGITNKDLLAWTTENAFDVTRALIPFTGSILFKAIIPGSLEREGVIEAIEVPPEGECGLIYHVDGEAFTPTELHQA